MRDGRFTRLLRNIEQSPPKIGFYPVLWLISFLNWLIDRLTPAPQRILQRSLGFLDSQIIFTCSELGISEALGDNILLFKELSEKLDLPEDSLSRLMKAAQQIGLFYVKRKGSIYYVKNNRLSWVLNEKHYAGLKPLLDHQAKEIAPAILNLSHSIKTAQNQAEFSAFQLTSLPSEFYQKDNLAEGKNHLPGVSSSKEDLLARSRNRNSKENGDSRFSKDTLWEYLEKRPSRQHNFSQAMRALDSIGRRAICEDYRWSKFNRILDIGGATGSFLQGLLETKKSLKGIVCDLPKVIEDAREEWYKQNQDVEEDLGNTPENQKALLKTQTSKRLEFVAIDLLKEESGIPVAQDGDCFLMRCILHDWDDAHCKIILKNVKKSMGNVNAKLVIVEMIPSAVERGLLCEAQRKSDLVMMCMTKGKERERKDWEKLLEETGFHLEKIQSTRSPFSVLTAS